ncbi:hypothetical protein HPB51_009594 [Rhipicephalus microplus]|uniref:Uncharacterized protein n=1 Tax=Rhipicephalus microplus TaxID=6941 RepID=A0A9J6DM37_RHIMP|nr:hypothetical protein HPB51_009594 [Rhipicephalus microplus]
MIMRDAVVEDSGNFDHLGFFNVHPNLSTRAYNISASIGNAAAAAGIRTHDLQPRAGFGLVLPLPACHSVKCTLGGGGAYDDGPAARLRPSAARSGVVAEPLLPCAGLKRRGVKRGGESHRLPLYFSNPGQPTAPTRGEPATYRQRIPHQRLAHPSSSPLVCTLLRQLHYVTSLMHLVPSSTCLAVCFRGTKVTVRADPSFL